MDSEQDLERCQEQLAVDSEDDRCADRDDHTPKGADILWQGRPVHAHRVDSGAGVHGLQVVLHGL